MRNQVFYQELLQNENDPSRIITKETVAQGIPKSWDQSRKSAVRSRITSTTITPDSDDVAETWRPQHRYRGCTCYVRCTFPRVTREQGGERTFSRRFEGIRHSSSLKQRKFKRKRLHRRRSACVIHVRTRTGVACLLQDDFTVIRNDAHKGQNPEELGNPFAKNGYLRLGGGADRRDLRY